tara:strand:+ start:247 stop:2016 length:1770 start_codon:yes stop_codon:yes gene_type:complete
MKSIVFGAGGFIGSHLVKRLKKDKHYVIGVDLKYPEFQDSKADNFIIGDLRDKDFVEYLFIQYDIDEVYQLAADMGGAEYIFSKENDADVMSNSVVINVNVLNAISNLKNKPKIFYSSSACIYPEENQLDPNNPVCIESTAYPANPDSEYGWEKIFSERLYQTFSRNKGINVRIARFHNIFGEFSTYSGGREKAPSAICRKVIENDTSIEIFGDGKQTRSFLYIDDCIEGIIRLMKSDYNLPVNIGSEELISINDLVKMICEFEKKNLNRIYIDNGLQGVRGRNSNNDLIYDKLNWKPTSKLIDGIQKLYRWIWIDIKKNLRILKENKENVKDYVIAVRSYRRADKIKKQTLRILEMDKIPKENIYLFVAPDEIETYRESIGDGYNICDGGDKGTNYCNLKIQDYFQEGQYIIQMDDDINFILKLRDDDDTSERQKVNGRIEPKGLKMYNTLELVNRGKELMNKHNFNLWGTSPVVNDYFMKKGYSTDLKFCIGRVFGFNNYKDVVTNDDCRDDYERSILWYERDGGIIRFSEVVVDADTYIGSGGLAESRTIDKMRKSCEYLLNTYPKYVATRKCKSKYPEIRLKRIK